MTPSHAAIFAYAAASRLAYVLFIGVALRRQERDGIYTRRYGTEQGFRRFRRVAAVFMNHDALAFIVLCFLTRGTMTLPVPRAVAIAVGVAFAIVGLGIKFWAARTLGANAYYWHNFFAPPPPPTAAVRPATAGPYRFASNPMYTIGYLQTYGWALITGSLPGLVAAAFAQAAILAFYFVVEKPHFERLHRAS
ncbi:MAG TPA: methyltransferase [Gemmatimonadales bacterium]|nr:methyltransferase [Gemmatimonadales bacterium]